MFSLTIPKACGSTRLVSQSDERARRRWMFPCKCTSIRSFDLVSGMQKLALTIKTHLARITAVAFLFALPQISVSAMASKDEEEIRKLETRQQEAWNKHDAKGYAALFTEDGDCVNVVGWWWKRRAEIEQKLTAAHAFVFQESVLTITSVDVRLLSPTVAIAHVRWTMTGARTLQSLPTPSQGIQTQTLIKSGGRWLIAAFQNTNAIPETPFPHGPPASAPQPTASP